MSRHANISVFVPHIGCPNRCSFCDQRSITGVCRAPSPRDVIRAVNTAKKSANYCAERTEIAFFGGSFTAIDRGYMESLLEAASGFVADGTVSGIRISTRPDAIDPEILGILARYRVTAVELGAQSMDDRVLRMNNRGHNAADVVRAAGMIRAAGFSLGLQMMTGLPGDSDEISMRTARDLAALCPDTVRIYPTIVLKNTDLAALYEDGMYRPQAIENAVALSAELLLFFREKGIRVIRLGLHSIDPDSYVAGPWHPAFSELCRAEIYFREAKRRLLTPGEYILYVNHSAVSQMAGQHRENLRRLSEDGFRCTVREDDSLAEFQIRTERTGDLPCC